MGNLKFRLSVHKFKCGKCDLLFLVEIHNEIHVSWYTCPHCNGITEHMKDITVLEEGSDETI